MDYAKLAVQMMASMWKLRKAIPQRHINESMQGEAFVLQCIERRGYEMLPGEISVEMDVSSARIAAALNSLEGKGLVTRQIDAKDRRKIVVRATQAGMDQARRHREALVADVEKMLALLGEHDAQEYVRIVGRLAELAPKRGRSPQK